MRWVGGDAINHHQLHTSNDIKRLRRDNHIDLKANAGFAAMPQIVDHKLLMLDPACKVEGLVPRA